MVGFCASCSTEPDPRPACDAGFEEAFTIGTLVINTAGRSFVPYDEGCNTVEVVSGIQGGWHIEPAIGAPLGRDTDTLGGTFEFVARDGQTIVTQDATFELEPRFWQSTGGAFVYWGDAIIFNAYPELGEHELEVTIVTDEETVDVSAVIELVDEEDESG